MKKQNSKLIVLTGGNTGGPVAPLLALAEAMHKLHPNTKFLFVGTRTGVEGHMAKKAGIPFVSIVAGKLRRYTSLKNVFAPFQFIVGLVQSYRILRRARPLCVVGAGGFVQVPVCYAAWLLGIPFFVHQQDVLPSLSNKLCAPLAAAVTVTFPESVADFPHGWTLGGLHKRDRVLWTGNPCRELKLPLREKALKHFGLDVEYPTLLFLGGGSGALSLNSLIKNSLFELTKYVNVLHITGKGKGVAPKKRYVRYKAVEFLDEMEYAYAAAEVVVSRAGLGTITELSALKKPALLVPIPGSHQEANALYLNKRGAALVVDQNLLTSDNLVAFVRSFLFDHGLQRQLGDHIHELMPQDASKRMAKIIWEAAVE